MSIVVGSSVDVPFVTSSASIVLYMVESSDSYILLLFLLLSVMPIYTPSVKTSELLVSLFGVE